MNMIKMYRSVSYSELCKLFEGRIVTGHWSGENEECGYSGMKGDVVCTFADNIKWFDGDHEVFLELNIPSDRIVEQGTGVWYMPKSFAKTKVYRGRMGCEKYELKEFYIYKYDIRDIAHIESDCKPEVICFGLENELYKRKTKHCPHYELEPTETMLETIKSYMTFSDKMLIPQKEFESIKDNLCTLFNN